MSIRRVSNSALRALNPRDLTQRQLDTLAMDYALEYLDTGNRDAQEWYQYLTDPLNGYRYATPLDPKFAHSKRCIFQSAGIPGCLCVDEPIEVYMDDTDDSGNVLEETACEA